MNPDPPILSIIIPTYNRLGLLQGSLEHLCAHLPSRVEVIVVDDGSTDGTGTAVKTGFGQVCYLRQDLRQGPAVARNLGLAHAKGAYFLPLDSDCFIVPETLSWLVNMLSTAQNKHFLLPCRSWPQGHRSVDSPREGLYSYKDILLKTYGEVVPVLATNSLRSLGLSYPALFAGGEPLLVLELSKHEPLWFVDRVILEYRTDVPMRISSTEYQLAHSAEIARVFEAYLPYFKDRAEPELQAELDRVQMKLGIYLALAGDFATARNFLHKSRFPAARVLQLATYLPRSVLRGCFRVGRFLQSLVKGSKG